MKRPADIHDAFRSFGFSSQESRVYIALLEGGRVNGSELAKRLGLTRASVYGSLEALVEKGGAHLLPGTPRQFEAVPFRQLLRTFRQTTSDCLEIIERELKDLPRHRTAEQVINVPDEARFHEELGAAFDAAKKEIYLSVCAPLEHSRRELAGAVRRGVRLIGFATQPTCRLEEGEWFLRELRLPRHDFSHRLLVVVDMHHGLAGGHDGSGNFLGIATRNPLLVKFLAEHIHHDIYLARMQAKTGKDPVRRQFLLGSLHEEAICPTEKKSR